MDGIWPTESYYHPQTFENCLPKEIDRNAIPHDTLIISGSIDLDVSNLLDSEDSFWDSSIFYACTTNVCKIESYNNNTIPKDIHIDYTSRN